MSWLSRWKPGLSLKIWLKKTGAETDVCLICGIERQTHPKLSHQFKEE